MSTRWEYGSEFHWVSASQTPVRPMLPPGAVLFGSGRDALRALIAMGIRQRGWRRWWVPSYFCQEVTAAIASTGIPIAFYEDSPLCGSPAPLPSSALPGDVRLVVNYFGLRGKEMLASVPSGPEEVVEDHTHDPWSGWATASRADFCLASLRKTLPVADGAALWSPKRLPLPDKPGLAPEHESACLMKLGAMILKRLYLDGHAIEKQSFRRLQIDGERTIACGSASGPGDFVEQLLSRLPWDAWRAVRAANHRLLVEGLSGVPGIRPIPAPPNESCPFSLILECRTPELRDRLRAGLIARSIYPAVLWPMESQGPGFSREAAQLAGRLLSLPCDFRYGPDDLGLVGEAVQQIATAVTSTG